MGEAAWLPPDDYRVKISRFCNFEIMEQQVTNTTDWIDQFIRFLPIDIQTALALKEQHLPERLYKFISLARDADKKLACLNNDQIWVANPATMNDPYDSGLYFLKNVFGNKLVKDDFFGFAAEAKLQEKFSPEEIEQIGKSEDVQMAIYEMLKQKYPEKADDIDKFIPAMEAIQKEWHKELLDGFNKKIRSSIKISCFTEVNDSLLMWSHYANSHTGICIEYEIKHSSDEFRKRLMYPIKYSEKFLDATKLMMDFKNAPLLATLAALYKSPEWSYEKEWRLIIPGGIITDDSPFDFLKPSAIYLGSKIDAADKEKVTALSKSRGIPVNQMHTKHDSFELFAEPV